MEGQFRNSNLIFSYLNTHKAAVLTFIANKSPVALFLARKTLPYAPLLIGLIISKSSIDVRSLVFVLIGLARKLRTVSSSTGLSSSAVWDEWTFSSAIWAYSWIYFSLAIHTQHEE